jgi:hypothetical protein
MHSTDIELPPPPATDAASHVDESARYVLAYLVLRGERSTDAMSEALHLPLATVDASTAALFAQGLVLSRVRFGVPRWCADLEAILSLETSIPYDGFQPAAGRVPRCREPGTG